MITRAARLRRTRCLRGVESLPVRCIMVPPDTCYVCVTRWMRWTAEVGPPERPGQTRPDRPAPGPISSCLAGSVPGGAMSRLRERDAAFRADEIAAAPAQLHLLRVTRAVWFLSRL